MNQGDLDIIRLWWDVRDIGSLSWARVTPEQARALLDWKPPLPPPQDCKHD